MYLGSLLYLNKSCHEERSTLSGAFNAVTRLLGIAGSLLGGALASASVSFRLGHKLVTWNYELAMIAAVLFSLIGLAIVLLGERTRPGIVRDVANAQPSPRI